MMSSKICHKNDRKNHEETTEAKSEAPVFRFLAYTSFRSIIRIDRDTIIATLAHALHRRVRPGGEGLWTGR